MHDAEFVRAGFRLLLAMEEHYLGTPLSVAWSAGYADNLPHLRVQVSATDFKDWLEALGSPRVDVELVQGTRHVHAHGALLHNEQVQVHLVAVHKLALA